MMKAPFTFTEVESSAHHYYNMSLALSKVQEYGYKRIALMLLEVRDELSEHAFYASFLYEKTFERANLSFDYLRPSDTISTDARKKIARDWLRKHDPALVIGEQLA